MNLGKNVGLSSTQPESFCDDTFKQAEEEVAAKTIQKAFRKFMESKGTQHINKPQIYLDHSKVIEEMETRDSTGPESCIDNSHKQSEEEAAKTIQIAFRKFMKGKRTEHINMPSTEHLDLLKDKEEIETRYATSHDICSHDSLKLTEEGAAKIIQKVFRKFIKNQRTQHITKRSMEHSDQLKSKEEVQTKDYTGPETCTDDSPKKTKEEAAKTMEHLDHSNVKEEIEARDSTVPGRCRDDSQKQTAEEAAKTIQKAFRNFMKSKRTQHITKHRIDLDHSKDMEEMETRDSTGPESCIDNSHKQTEEEAAKTIQIAFRKFMKGKRTEHINMPSTEHLDLLKDKEEIETKYPTGLEICSHDSLKQTEEAAAKIIQKVFRKFIKNKRTQYITKRSMEHLDHSKGKEEVQAKDYTGPEIRTDNSPKQTEEEAARIIQKLFQKYMKSKKTQHTTKSQIECIDHSKVKEEMETGDSTEPESFCDDSFKQIEDEASKTIKHLDHSKLKEEIEASDSTEPESHDLHKQIEKEAARTIQKAFRKFIKSKRTEHIDMPPTEHVDHLKSNEGLGNRDSNQPGSFCDDSLKQIEDEASKTTEHLDDSKGKKEIETRRPTGHEICSDDSIKRVEDEAAKTIEHLDHSKIMEEIEARDSTGPQIWNDDSYKETAEEAAKTIQKTFRKFMKSKRTELMNMPPTEHLDHLKVKEEINTGDSNQPDSFSDDSLKQIGDEASKTIERLDHSQIEDTIEARDSTEPESYSDELHKQTAEEAAKTIQKTFRKFMKSKRTELINMPPTEHTNHIKVKEEIEIGDSNQPASFCDDSVKQIGDETSKTIERLDHSQIEDTIEARDSTESESYSDELHKQTAEEAAKTIQKAFRKFRSKGTNYVTEWPLSEISETTSTRKSNWYVGDELIQAMTPSEISFEETEAYIELIPNPPYVVGNAISSSLELKNAIDTNAISAAPISYYNDNTILTNSQESNPISKENISDQTLLEPLMKTTSDKVGGDGHSPMEDPECDKKCY
ncbi:uncharacterized protein LOC109614019, partial [Musca domestica]|uniref:Uncharacterized protein LOC109614019 n=1 Tax=Musca domestica TaxID=7370 RepID=A0ABM3V0W4_MUSDO